MYPEIKSYAKKLIEEALGEEVNPEEVQDSPKADLACTSAFRLAKKLRKNPAEIASQAAGRIKPDGFIKSAEAVSGYINLSFDYEKVLPSLIDEVREKGPDYGRDKKKKEKVVLEHTSINPSGPLHIGRLRNSLIGDCLARVLRFSGYEVETHYFVNDVGKQIAIIAQGFAEDIPPDKDAMENYGEYSGKEDFKVFFEYVAANRRFEEDQSFASRVQERIRRAESGDERSLSEITDVARRCLSGQSEIYRRLGIAFDVFDYESKYIRSGEVAKVIESLKDSGYAKETDKGLGLDLISFGIERREGASIIARTDGTSVYLSRDVAYHLEKADRGDVLINVLGEDHKFEFLELKTILAEIFNVKKPLEVVHYSFVNFEGMELSTRKGLTAPIDSLIDEAVEKAEAEIKARGIASIEAASEIGIGAIKYHILKSSPHKPITFRWQEALSFDGEAAPYIQYSHARCCSILKKSGTDHGSLKPSCLGLAKEEQELVKAILRFTDIVERTCLERRPSILANYLHELASTVNRFYISCPVLSAEEDVKARRTLLVDASRQTIANGLRLLGIDAPEKM